MNKILIGSLAVFALTFVSCGQSSQPGSSGSSVVLPSSNAAQQTTTSFETSIYNTCCNENVDITGNEHIVFQSNDNGAHININVSDLVGTGDNGDTYHGGLNASEEVHNSDGSFNEVEHFTMTSSSGCKFKLTITYHVTFDANGNPHAERESFTTECF